MSAEPLLEVREVSVRYRVRSTQLSLRPSHLTAVDAVTFDVHRGETFALVGESGCGKSSLARTIVSLDRPAAGQVLFEGTDLSALSRAELRTHRRSIQLVHQNPYASFDPRKRIGASLVEPMDIHDEGTPPQRRERALEALAQVGLGQDHWHRYPHQLSGGQLQRASIARAFILSPQMVVLDEPVSALDVSVQAQVLNMLARLRDEAGTSYVVIAHDLAVVRRLAHRVGVMYLGRIVESGTRDQVYGQPTHPYTQALLAAVPTPDPEVEATRERIVLRGELPDPRNVPPGCAFASRCPLRSQLGDPDRCTDEAPEPRAVASGHSVACHFTDESRAA